MEAWPGALHRPDVRPAPPPDGQEAVTPDVEAEFTALEAGRLPGAVDAPAGALGSDRPAVRAAEHQAVGGPAAGQVVREQEAPQLGRDGHRAPPGVALDAHEG